ncbi:MULTISPECIES: phage tail tape measure protein [unclassified Chelatococcus]|uniref:phage tail tape measure protein n=1 Tax=unclassified Chelatococcus TaxID=2638111 RepID=UPI001BCD0BD5|nr:MULTISPECIES: phage tail tape measure protein [unclassified Chelatococcus]MBS7698683.1 phage tail tape measure protein [Chelatococcus sp. YT9]MBX3554735.1 phage tail tape measure protein [Chelatococcus sp.]
MATVTSSLILKLVDQMSGPAKGAAGSLKGLASATKDLEKLGKINAFREAMRSMKDASAAFKNAQEQVRRLKTELAGTDSPSRKLQSALKAAERAAASAKKAFMDQGQAARQARTALEQSGGSVRRLAGEEAKLRNAIDRTNAALQRRAQRADALRGLGGMGAAGALYMGYQARRFGQKAIVSAAEFDLGIKYQQNFQHLSDEEQAPLIAQAKKIGQETPFTNLDVVRAQTKAMQGLGPISPGMRAEIAQGLMEHVKNYALIMEADLETSAEAVRSYLLATRKDISTKEKALHEAGKAVNQIVKMAKLGGMDDEDVQQFFKYGAAAATALGLSTNTTMAMGALARRSGLRGDEAGVFIRSASAKLASPTKKGLAALNAGGINYSDYVGMPDTLSTDRLEGQFKQNMGVKLTDASKRRLSKIMSDKDIIKDRARFVEEVTGAVEQQFPTTKKGTMRPADRQNIAKVANTFHALSAQTVDAERLLDAIMSSSMTLAQLNAIFTDRQGGRGAITQAGWDDFKAMWLQIKNAGDDEDMAKNMATNIMSGLGGSLENLKGSVENLTLSIGKANEGVLKFSMDKLGNMFDGISEMDSKALQAASALGVLVVSTATLAAMWKGAKLLGGVLGLGGSDIALKGSALKLDGSAVALTRAAAVLAGSKGETLADLPKNAGAEKLGVVAALWRTLLSSAPMLAAVELANTTTPDENERLQRAKKTSQDVRREHGDATLAEARKRYQPWYARRSLDSEDENDADYVRRLLEDREKLKSKKSQVFKVPPSTEMNARDFTLGSNGLSRIGKSQPRSNQGYLSDWDTRRVAQVPTGLNAPRPDEVRQPELSPDHIRLGGPNVKAQVDTSALGAAKAEAQETGAGIKSALDVTAKPKVDTSDLTKTLDLARQINSELSRTGALAQSVGRAAQDRLAQKIRGIHADIGIEAR